MKDIVYIAKCEIKGSKASFLSFFVRSLCKKSASYE